MGDGAGGWRLSGGTETGEPPPVCAPCVLYSWFSTCHTPALCTVTAFEWTQRFIWHDNDSRQGACCFWWHERPQDVFYYDLDTFLLSCSAKWINRIWSPAGGDICLCPRLSFCDSVSQRKSLTPRWEQKNRMCCTVRFDWLVVCFMWSNYYFVMKIHILEFCI